MYWTKLRHHIISYVFQLIIFRARRIICPQKDQIVNHNFLNILRSDRQTTERRHLNKTLGLRLIIIPPLLCTAIPYILKQKSLGETRDTQYHRKISNSTPSRGQAIPPIQSKGRRQLPSSFIYIVQQSQIHTLKTQKTFQVPANHIYNTRFRVFRSFDIEN